MRLFSILSRHGGDGVPLGDGFPNITAPSGSASFTANWGTQAGADGYLVYVSTASQAAADSSLYDYRYKAEGQATASLAISSVAADDYYWRVAAYEGAVVGDLSGEVTSTAA